MKLFFIILAVAGLSSSFTSAVPVKKNVSPTVALGNYVITVRVINSDEIAGKVLEVFQQERRGQCRFHMEITNVYGFRGIIKEIKVWLRFASEKAIHKISSKLYNISNVIEVNFSKN